MFFVASWLAAGAGAVALAGTGVSAVGNQVTGSRPSPLSANEIRRELTASHPITSTTDPDAGTTTVASSSSTTTSTSVEGTGTPAGPRTAGATTTTSTTAAGPVAVTRTYALKGGTVTLDFAPSGVTYRGPTPRSGFNVSVEEEEDGGIRVEFSNETHRSRVTGWWDGGPRDEVREEDQQHGG